MSTVQGSLEPQPRKRGSRLAVAYLRTSGVGQIGNDGFPRQREAIAAYAKRNRLTVVSEFTDEAVSGTTLVENREGFAQLLDVLRDGDVKTVLVESASRLSRDVLVGEVALRTLMDMGVRDIACESGSDLADDTSPTAVMVRQILTAVSAFERSMVTARLRGARDRLSAQRGRRIEGPKPFGEGDDHERAAVETIRELAKKPRGRPRRSLRAIAKELDQRGYRTRSGRPWSPSTVRMVLQRLKTAS